MRYFRSLSGSPPLAREHLGKGRLFRGGGDRYGPCIAAREAQQLFAIQSNAVNGLHGGGDGAEHFRLALHARLSGDKVENGLAIGGRDVEQVDVRHAGRRGADDVLQQTPLHDPDGDREHHPHPKRHDSRAGVIAGSIQVRDPLADDGSGAAGKVTAENPEPPEEQPRHGGKGEHSAGDREGEVASGRGVVAEPRRQRADEGQNDDR